MTEQYEDDILDDMIAVYCEVREISEDDLLKMLENQYGEK